MVDFGGKPCTSVLWAIMPGAAGTREADPMATPIKATPVLSGKDAVRFAKAISAPAKPVSRHEYLRARSIYQAVEAKTGACRTKHP
jgi:hypothetical protein